MIGRSQHPLVQDFQQQGDIHRLDEVAGPAGFHRIEPGGDVATVGQEKEGGFRSQQLPQGFDLFQRGLVVGDEIQVDDQGGRLFGLR